MFSGNWGSDGVTLFGDDGSLTALYKVGRVPTGDSQTFGNKIMTTLGLASVVYTLGMKDAAVLTVKKVTNSNGQVWVICPTTAAVLGRLISLSETSPKGLLKGRRIERFAALFCCPSVTKLRLFSHFFQNLRVY